MNTFQYQFNDGGRKDAGFKSTARDCVTRSISIVSGIPYAEVYSVLSELNSEIKTKNGKKGAKTASHGIKTTDKRFKEYMKSLGFVWVPTMKVGQGCKTHLVPSELPSGRMVVRVSRHCTAVVDGVVHDTFDPTRDGSRCVYGYYILN